MNSLATNLKALSEEIRLRILSLLTVGEMCVCDLMEALELPQSTVSRHLAYLRNSGWVVGNRKGAWMYYRLAEPSETVQARVMGVLVEELPKTEAGLRDRLALEKYLATKPADACDGSAGGGE